MAIDINVMMEDIGLRAKKASVQLAVANAGLKTDALLLAADLLWHNRSDIMVENGKDMQFGRKKGLSAAMLDRLMLDEKRIAAMVAGVRTIAKQDDLVGTVLAQWRRPSGLHIQRVRTPLGVIGVIYESRPNVTADAGALCLKAGSAVILRGGSESIYSSIAICNCLRKGLLKVGVPIDAIQLVPIRNRKAVEILLTMREVIDVIVPRGGKNLVARVNALARVPVFAHLEGICHAYVDATADIVKARKVIMNAKTRRAGICGALECILIDRQFYHKNGAPFINDLLQAGVEVRGDADLQEIDAVVAATDDDWGYEYLDMIVAARLVDGVKGAIAYLHQFSSNHTDCIISEDAAAVDMFFQQVDSAIVLHNASTQFADGGEFGMGGEIGIATGKLHARGPVGVEQLMSFKYLVRGNGTIRD